MKRRITAVLVGVSLTAAFVSAADNGGHPSGGGGCETFLDLGLSAGGGEYDYYHTSESGGANATGYTRIATLYNRGGSDAAIYSGLTGAYAVHAYCGP